MPERYNPLRCAEVGPPLEPGTLVGGSFFGFIFIGTLYMQQVLGYSALQAGGAWLATTLTTLALAGLSQRLVTRISLGPVLAVGMALVGGGILWAAQAPVHGHFWGSLAGPFFVAGAGGAFSFVAVSIGGLAGIAEREAGVASGLRPTVQPAQINESFAALLDWNRQDVRVSDRGHSGSHRRQSVRAAQVGGCGRRVG